MQDEHTIRTVLFQEGGWWVAQCLDVDIAAQARTERDLYYELGRLLVGRILAGEKLGVDPFRSLPPAPKRYWDMFFDATSQPKTMLPFVPMDGGGNHALPQLEMKAVAA
jgi:hypothetical protein